MSRKPESPTGFPTLQSRVLPKGYGDNMEEVWKDIDGYEGLYQVSNLGRVKSLERMIPYARGMRRIPEKIMILEKNTDGYWRIKLVKDHTKKNVKIHRLVAEAFIPNPEGKRCINHIDGDKANNCMDNLEWVTHSENMMHASNVGLLAKHKKPYHWKHGHSEETKQKLRELNTGRRYSWGHGHTEEAKRHISEALKNRTKDKKAQ